MVAVPAAIPVTMPVPDPTVAILVLLLLHEPPEVVLVNVVVAPAQTVKVPAISARELIVMDMGTVLDPLMGH